MEDTAIDAGALTPEPGHLAELPRSLAEVVTMHDGDVVTYELSLSPGATAADVTAAMILMPPAVGLVVGTRISLAFTEPSRSPAGAIVWSTDANRAATDGLPAA
jgi:uncharacterized repeat protein (TIGR03917 family)